MKSVKRVFCGLILAVLFIFVFDYSEVCFSDQEQFLYAEHINEKGLVVDEMNDYDKFIINVKKCKNYLRKYNYSYDMSYAKSIPLHLNTERVVDCSSYVSWVLYESGYDEFRGSQWSSYTFSSLLYHPENYNFKTWKCRPGVPDKNELKLGDILIYQGHVEFYAGTMSGERPRVYNCGYTDAIRSKTLVTTSSKSIYQLKGYIRVE